MPPEDGSHHGDEEILQPSSDLPWSTRLVQEVREQLRTSVPTLAGMLLYKFPWLISLRFVGGIGAEELAAAALATTLCNVTGLSLSVGLSSALTTLTGQSRGDLLARQEVQDRKKVKFHNKVTSDEETTSLLKSAQDSIGYQTAKNTKLNLTLDSGKPLLPLVYLYRGLFIQLLFVIPIGIWWIIGIKPVLIALGQGEHLSTLTEAYLRILAPGLWSYSINWTLTAWLQAIEMADVPAYAAAIGLISHIPFNTFFIYTLQWGYLGCAVATVLFQLIQPVLMLTYLFYFQRGRRRALKNVAARGIRRTTLSFWREAKIAVSSMPGILQYLGLAVPGVVIISEWWASEISIFLAGRLQPSPSLSLGGMTIYQSINTFCFMFPIACSVAGSTRVGNLLGAGNTDAADFASKVSIICAGTVSGLLSCILFFTPHTFFPSLFAPAEYELIHEASRTISLLSLYVFADGIQASFNGIIKGCGRQLITMPIVIIAYWFVALPLAYYLAFIRHGGFDCDDQFFCGDVGLVTGMTTGTWVHMLLLAVIVIGTTNWDVEARKAQQRLEAYTEREKAPAVSEDVNKRMDLLSL